MSNRYSRQSLFTEIGEEGQAKIRGSRVLVVGVGALGSASAEMLVRAGIGYLRVIDRDYVDETNLQRQSLFDEECVHKSLPKAAAAADKLKRINHEVEIDGRVGDVNPDNIEEALSGIDLMLDGTDNFETRYLLNDASVRAGIPWIYAACVGSYGMSFVVRPGTTPCLRCFMEEEPPLGSTPTCDTAGVIAPVVHAVTAFQVTEALKILAGREDALLGSVLAVDVWQGKWDAFRMARRREDCPACGLGKFDYLSGKSKSQAVTLCGRNAVQVRPGSGGGLKLDELADRLRSVTEVKANPHLLRFTVEGKDVVVFADGRAMIHGTNEESVAKSIYSKYIGL